MTFYVRPPLEEPERDLLGLCWKESGQHNERFDARQKATKLALLPLPLRVPALGEALGDGVLSFGAALFLGGALFLGTAALLGAAGLAGFLGAALFGAGLEILAVAVWLRGRSELAFSPNVQDPQKDQPWL